MCQNAEWVILSPVKELNKQIPVHPVEEHIIESPFHSTFHSCTVKRSGAEYPEDATLCNTKLLVKYA